MIQKDRICLSVGAFLLTQGAALKAQANLPAFEAASIKLRDPNILQLQGVQVQPGGRIVLSALSLKVLIRVAFQVAPKDISGVEPWMDKEEYNIQAVPSPEWRAKITNLKHTVFDIDDEHLRQMLQSLLIEQFQLKFHRETKAATVYFLKRSEKPLRLRTSEAKVAVDGASTAQRPFGSVGYAGGKWVIAATTMPQLAKFAGDNILRTKVTDQTGLVGTFDFRQRESDLDPDYRNPSESFLRMISDIGLKLERSEGRVPVFAIEHAARPSTN